MKFYTVFVFLLITLGNLNAQIAGNITNTKGEKLAFVNIYIENTFIGTTSNNDGNYELNVIHKNNYTIGFKYLGYKTLKKTITVNTFPHKLNVVMEEEIVALGEVTIKSNTNPANTIIRQAINKRTFNLEKIRSYKANFYSRGLIRIKGAPKKVLGQKVDDVFKDLDSTRSGIIYLSETISEIDYLFPDKLKEKIIASKVSGDDNGFSFNSAGDAEFNFYKNTINLGNEIVSPIADYAFTYYTYKLEGSFFDSSGKLINKIKVIPRRVLDRIFSGTIYIVDDSWDIYAIKLSATGEQAQLPAANNIVIEQSFSYSKNQDIWAKLSQSIDFDYGILGLNGNGRFTAVYSDYEFNTSLTTKDFSREILVFEKNANKKDSLYWKNKRPVPLTTEEKIDYKKKDSLQILKKTTTYLDSVDKKNNRFNIFDLILGYSYQNSHKNTRLNFSGPLRAMSFNTVQGANARANFNFRKNYDEFNRYLNVFTSLNYSVADRVIRPTTEITYKFNNITKTMLGISGGNMVEQFNNANPIHITVNSIGSLFFEKNYMKLYARTFIQSDFSVEIINGIRFFTSLSFEKRKPLFNTSGNLFIDYDDTNYTSNNPLDPDSFGVGPFETHNIFKANLVARIRFGQNYFSYPDTKINIRNVKYPTLFLGLENGFGSDDSNNNYTQLKLRLTQDINFDNKGLLRYNTRIGTFIDANDIAFMDFQHFKGNQTAVGTASNYLNTFNNLPYYSHSTNNAYFEFHAEHNFKGYILGKIPLLNKLNYNLVLGGHALSTKENKPYQELSIGIDNIGWKKFRFLRFDYVHSFGCNYNGTAYIFGLKFFGLFN